jgi:hypothetical protein
VTAAYGMHRTPPAWREADCWTDDDGRLWVTAPGSLPPPPADDDAPPVVEAEDLERLAQLELPPARKDVDQ